MPRPEPWSGAGPGSTDAASGSSSAKPSDGQQAHAQRDRHDTSQRHREQPGPSTAAQIREAAAQHRDEAQRAETLGHDHALVEQLRGFDRDEQRDGAGGAVVDAESTLAIRAQSSAVSTPQSACAASSPAASPASRRSSARTVRRGTERSGGIQPVSAECR